MRAVTYARVSSDRQDKGASPEVQAAETLALVTKEGFQHVGHFYDAGVSGTVRPRDRPQFGALWALLEAGEADVLVAHAQDRITRKEGHWHDLADDLDALGVEVVTWDGTDSRREGSTLLAGFKVLIAAQERRDIARRTISGKVVRARMNLYVGGPAPYAYKRVRNHDLKVTALEVEPREAEVVLRAAALLVEGKHRVHEIARILNEEGSRSRGGPVGRSPIPWSGSMIREMLGQEMLTGRLVWQSPEGPIEQTWPPVLSRERFEDVQRCLRETKVSPYSSRRVYPLSGVLVMPCGRTASGQYCNDRRYYRCKGRDHAPRCDCRMLWASVVEELAWTTLLNHLSDPDALFLTLDPIYVPRDDEDTAVRLGELDADVTRIEDALVATAVRFAHLPQKVIAEATRELEAQLVLAQDRRAMARRLALDKENHARQRAAIQDLADRVSRGLRTLSLEGQRRLYTSEATGIEAVIVTQERPLALQIRVRDLIPTAFAPQGSIITLSEGLSATLSFDLIAVG